MHSGFISLSILYDEVAVHTYVIFLQNQCKLIIKLERIV